MRSSSPSSCAAGAFYADDFPPPTGRCGPRSGWPTQPMSAGSARLPGILLLLASIAAVALGDDGVAHRLNRRLVDFSRDTGAMTMLTQALPRLASHQIANGQWSSAAAGLEDGIRLARQSGQHQVVAQMQSDQALLAALRGEDETCRALAAESTSGRSPGGCSTSGTPRAGRSCCSS